MPSISRRELFVSTLGVLIVGCAELSLTADEEPTAIAQYFDCTMASRPAPDVQAGVEVEVEDEEGGTRTFESFGSTEYPDPPTSQDEAVVKKFLRKHEAAYRQNQLADVYEEELTNFAVEFDEIQSGESRGDVQRFTLSYEEVFETVDLAGHGPTTVMYAIDETGLSRFDRVPSDEGDKENTLKYGKLVACF